MFIKYYMYENVNILFKMKPLLRRSEDPYPNHYPQTFFCNVIMTAEVVFSNPQIGTLHPLDEGSMLLITFLG